MWREISWLKNLSKDRRTRKCNYEIYASLAMHSRTHQDFLRETVILSMCISGRKEELTNGRRLWWQTRIDVRMLDISLSFSLFRSLFSLLFILSIANIYKVCPESIGPTFISPHWRYSSSSGGWHPSK